MTAGPESECLRRATRYSARGIEAAWPRRCAARFTRARCGDSRTRKDEKQQQRELGKCGYSRTFETDWRHLEPRLLCLLAEMQQEIATRDLDPKLLQEILQNLSQLEETCKTDHETYEHLQILRALGLRRLGERGDCSHLDESIAIHRKLLLGPTKRRIEISSSFGKYRFRTKSN